MCLASALPHAIPLFPESDGQLDLHVSCRLVGHWVIELVQIGPQAQAVGAHETIRLDAGLVLVEALVGAQPGHADVEAGHAVNVVRVGLAEPRLVEHALRELDDVDAVMMAHRGLAQVLGGPGIVYLGQFEPIARSALQPESYPPPLISRYDTDAELLAAQYERLRFEDVHAPLLDLLPGSGAILDVGAGSGRDAAWLAARGYEVTAVEPSAAMRRAAQSRHGAAAVRWIDDALPALPTIHRHGLSFDLILLSGVWMHVPPDERSRAWRKLVTLLRPCGRLAVSLRLGPGDPGRQMYAVSQEELERLAREFGLVVVRAAAAADLLGRPEVSWLTVVMQLPDDGAGALSLLRHIVLKDDKSSTYKLALLRVLARIADAATGLIRIEDEHVGVPLGLVALYWIRMFKPLVEQDCPQAPAHRAGRGLGFLTDHFHALRSLSAQDLRPGMRFSGATGAAVWGALRTPSRVVEQERARHRAHLRGGRGHAPG